MIDKTYRTVAQLIDILRSRGMVIEDGAPHDTAMRILETENYYNIVNGYKDLFLSPASAPSQEHYRNGTTFEELYALYQFDRDIRHIYLKYLLKVENTFKSVLAHEFSALYGHDNYLKLENFDAVRRHPAGDGAANEQASSGRHTLFIGVWLYSLMGLGERPDLWQGHDVL